MIKYHHLAANLLIFHNVVPIATLNCLPLQTTTEWKNTKGEVTSTTADRVEKFFLNPPSAELFNLPTDYREVAPSEMRDAIFSAKSLPHPANYAKKNQVSDKQYWSLRPTQ